MKAVLGFAKTIAQGNLLVMNKSEIVSMRIDDTLKKKIEKLAREDGRSTAGQMRYMLEFALKSKKFQK